MTKYKNFKVLVSSLLFRIVQCIPSRNQKGPSISFLNGGELKRSPTICLKRFGEDHSRRLYQKCTSFSLVHVRCRFQENKTSSDVLSGSPSCSNLSLRIGFMFNRSGPSEMIGTNRLSDTLVFSFDSEIS